jgi:Mg-chelatase subunit ChlD
MGELTTTGDNKPLSPQEWRAKLGVAKTTQAKALNGRSTKDIVCLVIDVSESMDMRHKLEYAQHGAIGFAKEALTQDYAVAVVSFGSSAEVHIRPTKDIEQISRAINNLYLRGSTGMAAGITTATNIVKEAIMEQSMCIVTDGMPDSQAAALEAASAAKAQGIQILTIGTEDADWEFLAKIASAKDLAKKVTPDQLEGGITDMAKLLPPSS